MNRYSSLNKSTAFLTHKCWTITVQTLHSRSLDPLIGLPNVHLGYFLHRHWRASFLVCLSFAGGWIYSIYIACISCICSIHTSNYLHVWIGPLVMTKGRSPTTMLSNGGTLLLQIVSGSMLNLNISSLKMYRESIALNKKCSRKIGNDCCLCKCIYSAFCYTQLNVSVRHLLTSVAV